MSGETAISDNPLTLKQSEFNSLSDLKAYTASVEKGRRLFILFTGNKVDGVSWCPDCNVADPVVHKSLSLLNGETDEFITCYVGDRTTWKNPENEFRTDRETKLVCVPTLVLWKSVLSIFNILFNYF